MSSLLSVLRVSTFNFEQLLVVKHILFYFLTLSTEHSSISEKGVNIQVSVINLTLDFNFSFNFKSINISPQ